MKKILYVLAAAAVVFALASCTTTDTTTAKQGWANYSELSVKDFNTLGIVSVTTEMIQTSGFLQLTRKTEGSTVTYNALMEEAKKLGADDIINVRIDQVSQGKSGPIQLIFGGKTTTKYIGTALAIKYKDVAPNTRQREQAAETHSLPTGANPGFGGGLLDGIMDLLPF